MNVAFIPARGGSKSIPLKNIQQVNGKPLIYWTIKAACECKKIDMVYVATDSKEIRNVVEELKMKNSIVNEEKVKVINRTKESASDTAPTEMAMLEFANQYDFENIVLIQATSPLVTRNDLDNGFEIFENKDTDSVVSGVRGKQFLWLEGDNGIIEPWNYDGYNRPRRQDYNGYIIENGAFYITTKENLLKSKNRFSGTVKVCEMNVNTLFEIDEPSDFVNIESVMQNIMKWERQGNEYR